MLVAPKGDTTRPTADRTREALFSMLVSRLGSFQGLRVADLFAGSGALGLEALSRGAATCTFVEQDRQALDALRTNVAALKAQADIRAQSATTLAPAREPYDLVLMDPPYGTGAGQVVLDRCRRLGWVAPGSFVSIESGRAETVEVPNFIVEAERIHGKAKITLLRLDVQ